jgi:hypothetical protein
LLHLCACTHHVRHVQSAQDLNLLVTMCSACSPSPTVCHHAYKRGSKGGCMVAAPCVPAYISYLYLPCHALPWSLPCHALPWSLPCHVARHWGVRVQLPCSLVRARGTLGMGGGPAACALVELARSLAVPLPGTLSFISKTNICISYYLHTQPSLV